MGRLKADGLALGGRSGSLGIAHRTRPPSARRITGIDFFRARAGLSKLRQANQRSASVYTFFRRDDRGGGLQLGGGAGCAALPASTTTPLAHRRSPPHRR